MEFECCDIIKLNVGGTHEMQTTRNVLCNGPAQGSKLSQFFSSNSLQVDDQGRVFIDRDGKPFWTMINYLRNECQIPPIFDSNTDEK